MNLKTTDQLPIDPITQQHSGKQHQDSQHHRPGSGCPLPAQDRVRRKQHPRHGSSLYFTFGRQQQRHQLHHECHHCQHEQEKHGHLPVGIVRQHHRLRNLPERPAYIQPKVGAVVAVCKDHPARDGDCEKIRAGISAAVRNVKESSQAIYESKFHSVNPVNLLAEGFSKASTMNKSGTACPLFLSFEWTRLIFCSFLSWSPILINKRIP